VLFEIVVLRRKMSGVFSKKSKINVTVELWGEYYRPPRRLGFGIFSPTWVEIFFGKLCVGGKILKFGPLCILLSGVRMNGIGYVALNAIYMGCVFGSA